LCLVHPLLVWSLRDCGRLVGFEVAPLVGSDGVGCVSCGASCVSRLCDWCWCRCASSSEHGCLEWTLVSPPGRVCLFWHVRFGRAGNVRRWSILVDRLVASWVVLKSRVWYTFMCVSCARQRAPPASPYGRACDGPWCLQCELWMPLVCSRVRPASYAGVRHVQFVCLLSFPRLPG
jgi:hypothetical protein